MVECIIKDRPLLENIFSPLSFRLIFQTLLESRTSKAHKFSDKTVSTVWETAAHSNFNCVCVVLVAALRSFRHITLAQRLRL